MKGILPWFAGLFAVTRDFCPASAAVVGPVQNIFFHTVHCFTSFVPIAIARQAYQAVVQRRLSLDMCLWEEVSVCVQEKEF